MLGDSVRRPSHVISHHGPHHSQESELLLNLAEAQPTESVWRAHDHRRDAGLMGDYMLRFGKFALNKLGRFKRQSRMRITVVAELMTGRSNLTGNLRIATHVETALEEGAPD